MTKELLSYVVFPAGALAAIAATWVFLALIIGVLHKRSRMTEHSQNPPAPAPAIGQAALQVRRGLAFIIATPLAALAAGLFGLLEGKLDDEGYALFGLITVGILFWVVAFLIHRGARARLREAQWQEAAMAAVARTVAPLAERGHVVFQDFRAEDIAIDYVIIGPKGIFALQRMIQPSDAHGKTDSEPLVTYNGRALFFPHGREHLMLDWAHEQAERFSEWISQGLETPVSARAILALPGWRVKRISADGVSVINPTQLEALFQYVKPRPLSPGEIQAIVARLQAHYGAEWRAPDLQSESQPA